MTLYILDATIVAEYLIMGPYTGNAQALLKSVFTGNQFAAPELCLNECTNVIWKAVRFRGMPRQQALQAIRDLKALPLRRVPTKAVLETALAVGLKHDLPVYDSLYIALALRGRQPFITLDGRQQRAALAEGVSVVPITGFQ